MEKRKRIVLKITTIIIILLSISNMVFAAFDPSPYDPYDPSHKMPGGLEDIFKTALGVIQIVAGFAAFISLVWLGVSFMKESPQGKAESKKKIYTMLIGAVLIFGASKIVEIVVELVKE